jgi:hypothetical protein
VRVTLQPGVEAADVVDALHHFDGVHVDRVAVEKHHGSYVVAAHLHADPKVDVDVYLPPISRRDDVESFEEEIGAD